MNILKLKLRMWLLLTLLFGIVYALVAAVSTLFGIGNFVFFGFVAVGFVLLQYMIGPKIVEWTMRVKYVSENEAPKLHKMIAELAKEAGIPKPRVGVSHSHVPNAFAFGRWGSDGRVCVTQGILDLLSDDELRAVLGHEISHLKHRDVAVITALSTIPMICWFLSRGLLFSGERDRGHAALIGLLAFVLYFITNLLVLAGSRIREYYADAGSVTLGNQPHALASALYKLVRGTVHAPRSELKQIEGLKAFFANDVSRAHLELRELAQIDLDGSGHIDEKELELVRNAQIKIGLTDRLMEVLSTHPNMLKRVKALSQLK